MNTPVVHRVASGTFSNLVQTTKGNTMNTNATPVAAALSEAGLSETSRTSYFMSEHVSRQIAWGLGNLVGQICTRIQKLAQGKGTVADEAVPGETIKAKVRSMIQRLAWGYETIGSYMPTIDEKVFEWCGGGYSRSAKKEELATAASFLGMTIEQMQAADEARRRNMTDYLTIRRAGLQPVMVSKIESLISSNLEGIEPTSEEVEAACQRAFENRLMFGDWAGAALAKDDMVYHTGKAPTQPAADSSFHEKATRIREELANKQAEQALKDSADVVAFDPLSILAA